MEAVDIYSAMMRIRPAQACQVLKQVLGIKRRPIPTSFGCSYFADPVSVFGVDLLRSGIYEPELTALFRSVLRPGDVCVDIGGNEGYFSILAGQIVGGAGVVHCVEPQSRLQSVLRKNIELNGLANVVTHQLAIGENGNPVRLFLRPSTNTGASSLYRHWRIGSASELVKSATLDETLGELKIRSVRLLKVDCEGAEWAVIQGGRQTLVEQKIDVVAMAYHPSICGQSRCDEIHAHLIGAGYKVGSRDGHCIYYLQKRVPELSNQISLDK